MAEITVTKENFEEKVLQAPVPVLVDFWATWCGPCRMLMPTLEAFAEAQAGKVLVGKCNVDDEPELAEQFRVDLIPTLIVFKDGKLVAKTMGVQTMAQLEKLVQADS